MSVSATTYTITIGAGGRGGNSAPDMDAKGGLTGGNSTIVGPDITTITANGGGGGAGNSVIATAGGSGGGGEGAYSPAPVSASKLVVVIQDQLNKVIGGEGSTNGGDYPSSTRRAGGGGGGAGGIGSPGASSEPDEGGGGIGLQVKIAGAPPLNQPIELLVQILVGDIFAGGGHHWCIFNQNLPLFLSQIMVEVVMEVKVLVEEVMQ